MTSGKTPADRAAAALAARRWACANPEGCRAPARPTWYPGHCRVCGSYGGEYGALAESGIPPYEILDPDGVCPSCGCEAPESTTCHVCGAAGKPGDYFEALAGAKRPDESPIVPAVESALAGVRTPEGDLDAVELRRWLTRQGVTSPDEADDWSSLFRSYVAGWSTATAVARWKASKTPAKGGA